MAGTADVRGARSQWWRELEPHLRLLSATIIIGAVSGAVIGGLGGRLAMRILFLTSGDAVKGLTNDLPPTNGASLTRLPPPNRRVHHTRHPYHSKARSTSARSSITARR